MVLQCLFAPLPWWDPWKARGQGMVGWLWSGGRSVGGYGVPKDTQNQNTKRSNLQQQKMGLCFFFAKICMVSSSKGIQMFWLHF